MDVLAEDEFAAMEFDVEVVGVDTSMDADVAVDANDDAEDALSANNDANADELVKDDDEFEDSRSMLMTRLSSKLKYFLDTGEVYLPVLRVFHALMYP